MKIQLASDLHLELLQHRWPDERLITPAPDADVLVLAGDIHEGTSALEIFAPWASEQEIPIIYVAGNHEYYHGTLSGIQQRLLEDSPVAGVHFLERQTLVLGGVRFLGCTLWTDYNLRSMFSRAHVMEDIQRRLKDHYEIRTDQGLFTPQDALTIHAASVQWLAEELEKPFAGKTVVVTHHGPHPLSVHPRYAGDKLNAAYVSDLSPLLRRADLWLHGHVHDSFDYQVGRCRVVTNPAGYVRNRSTARSESEFVLENTGFNKALLIELG